MTKPIDQAQDILSSKGSALMQSDLDAMEEIFTKIPPEEWDDVMLLMDGVARIVHDPSYEGDIKPIE
jgi:hypothetical protein